MVGSETITVVGAWLAIGCVIMSSGKIEINKGCLLTFQIKYVHRSSSVMACSSLALSSIVEKISPLHCYIGYNQEYATYSCGGGGRDETSCKVVRLNKVQNGS
jgi:hypothetical protein